MALTQELRLPVAQSRRPFFGFLEREGILGYLLILPAVLYIVALVGYPFLLALWFSVSDASVGKPNADFIGLGNFQWAVETDLFREALKNTFILTIAGELVKAVLGTLLALLLVREFRGRRL